MPKLPGAVLGPNSKTSRSNPDWCAMRTGVSCAWFAAPPALTRGHAAAGVDPGVGATEGAPVGEAVTLAPGVARAGLGVAVRGADGLGPSGSDGRTTGWGAQALPTTMPSATASAP